MSGVSNAYDRLSESIGEENICLELQFNKLPAQHLVNRAIIEFAKQSNLTDRLIVTCDSHYARPEHWKEREIYKKLGWLNYTDYDPSSLPQTKDDLKCELYPKNATQPPEGSSSRISCASFHLFLTQLGLDKAYLF